LQPGKIFCFQIRGRVRNGNPPWAGFPPRHCDREKSSVFKFAAVFGMGIPPWAGFPPRHCDREKSFIYFLCVKMGRIVAIRMSFPTFGRAIHPDGC